MNKKNQMMLQKENKNSLLPSTEEMILPQDKGQGNGYSYSFSKEELRVVEGLFEEADVNNVDFEKIEGKILPQPSYSKPSPMGNVFARSREIEKRITKNSSKTNDNSQIVSAVLNKWTSMQKIIKEEITLEEISKYSTYLLQCQNSQR